MSSPSIEHPLALTFSRIAQINQYIKAQTGAPTDEGWVNLVLLFQPDLHELDALVAHTKTKMNITAANLIASCILQNYQWPLIASAVASYLIGCRVPDLSPDNVLVRYSAAYEAEAITYPHGRFFALADDPAAAHADAHVVADREALRSQLRSGIETHLGWVIKQLQARLGCSPRGLWLAVADRCAGTVSWLMQEQNTRMGYNAIEAEVNALIRALGSPLVNKQVGLFELTYKTKRHVYLDRATCCYWYKMEDGDYCTICPHRTKEDRNERLLKDMADQYKKGVA
jgi:hypothetical protein